jgi:hypothetical protein
VCRSEKSAEREREILRLTEVLLLRAHLTVRAIRSIQDILVQEPFLPLSDPPFSQTRQQDLCRANSTDPVSRSVESWIRACSYAVNIDKDIKLDERCEATRLALQVCHDLINKSERDACGQTHGMPSSKRRGSQLLDKYPLASTSERSCSPTGRQPRARSGRSSRKLRTIVSGPRYPTCLAGAGRARATHDSALVYRCHRTKLDKNRI